MSRAQATHRRSAKQRDGLGSAITPLKGKKLSPRTHAIHMILYGAFPAFLSRREIEERLTARGYKDETVEVTREHLRSLEKGWGKAGIKAVTRDAEGRYRLTVEARDLLADAPPIR